MTASLERRIDRQDWMKFFTHLTVILIIFVLPEVMFRASRPQWRISETWYLVTFVKTAVYLALFYLSYFVLIPRTLISSKRHIWAFIFSSIGAMVIAIGFLYIMQHWILWPTDKPMRLGDHSKMKFLSTVVRDFTMMTLTLGLSAALRFGEKWSQIQQNHEKMLAWQRAEELESLKSQLNPHFLFNTLNTIYALIEISPEQAQEAVHELSALLRYVMYENPATVKLSREIGFAKSYISLMEVRLGPDAVEAHFDEGSNPEVAPLLFISLIENAFKHGNAGIKKHPIEISIVATPDGEVICRTVNHWLPQPEATVKKGGIGLSNLRRRLQLLYGNRATLETRLEDDLYIATLTIKTNESDKMLRN